VRWQFQFNGNTLSMVSNIFTINLPLNNHQRRRDRATRSHPHDHMINSDETAWRVGLNGLLTWAPVGADAISFVLNASDEERISVLASITAAPTLIHCERSPCAGET
jgi:hypothetical protein